MKVILIDSGTTNSRIRLVENHKVIDNLKIRIGVKNTVIEGSKEVLKKNLSEGIKNILYRNGLSSSSIAYIAASGMITSNVGLYEVPHVNFPTNIKKLIKNAEIVNIKGFFDIPCIFIPGMKKDALKNKRDIISYINSLDIMRGEEVETIGFLKQFSVKEDGIVVLPGSHTKYVGVDNEKNLIYSLSTLGGETLQAINKETILSSSLQGKLIETIDHEWLLKGYSSAKKYGLTRALYHIRLFQLFTNCDANQRANYLVGSIVYSDIRALLTSVDLKDIKWLIIGGTSMLREVFAYFLERLNYDWDIIKANEEQAELATVIGTQEVAYQKYISAY